MPRAIRLIMLMCCLSLLNAVSSFAQGACPAGLPVTGNNCFFIAASGSDTNSGTSESSPWAHAPGMPNCKSNCAAITPSAGEGFIFRGGDTWHFGNSAASPYTGGEWNWTWDGSAANCDTSDNPSPVRTSCVYVGVDKNWFSGSFWSRPVMNGDNPISTTAVGSCNFQAGSDNDFLSVGNDAYAIFDNLEFAGMCQKISQNSGNNFGFGQNVYLTDNGGSTASVQNVYENLYFHGFTHLPFSCSESSGEPVGICFNSTAIQTRVNGSSTFGPGIVCDGGDSDPTDVACLLYGGYLVYDDVFENMAQIVVDGYHDWHDNLWQNYFPTGDGFAHGNSFESNDDAPGTDSGGHNQPNVPFNVFYNNILGHNSSGTTGDVKLWFCVNNFAAEYQFNNIVYDQGSGNNWDIDNSCGGSAKIYEFSNTIDMPGAGAMNCTANLIAEGNHEIVDGGSVYASGPCSISHEIVMTHATAVMQGYMAAGTGTSGNNGNTTCLNDTRPCAPTQKSNATVAPAGGVNLQSYCNALLGSSQSMIVNAGKACQSGATDACTYDTGTHSVICPSQAAVMRPTGTTIWDAGAYQFQASTTQGPQPPTNLLIVVH